MTDHQLVPSRRRAVLAGAGAATLLALSGCATMRRNAIANAVRKLLRESVQRAIAKATGPDGTWAQEVRRFDFERRLGRGAGLLGNLLTSPQARERLEDLLYDVADRAIEHAVPILVRTVEQMGIPETRRLVDGGPTAATEFLHSQMGHRLIEEMIPGLAEAVRIGRDPLLGSAVNALTGVDLAGLPEEIAETADRFIWRQIGNEEAAIRADPASTGDADLIEVFGRA